MVRTLEIMISMSRTRTKKEMSFFTTLKDSRLLKHQISEMSRLSSKPDGAGLSSTNKYTAFGEYHA